MWIVKIITFIEYHPYIFLTFILIIVGIVRFFWQEHNRLSYRQQNELEKLLKGFEEARKIINETQKLKKHPQNKKLLNITPHNDWE